MHRGGPEHGQGIGGAMMVPVGRLVILRSTAKSDLVSAMAWLLVVLLGDMSFATG